MAGVYAHCFSLSRFSRSNPEYRMSRLRAAYHRYVRACEYNSLTRANFSSQWNSKSHDSNAHIHSISIGNAQTVSNWGDSGSHVHAGCKMRFDILCMKIALYKKHDCSKLFSLLAASANHKNRKREIVLSGKYRSLACSVPSQWNPAHPRTSTCNISPYIFQEPAPPLLPPYIFLPPTYNIPSPSHCPIPFVLKLAHTYQYQGVPARAPHGLIP